MKAVFFYVFEQASLQEAWLHLCKLIQEWYQAGEVLEIHCKDEPSAKRFDHLLWTFSDQSFIPHRTNSETSLQVGKLSAWDLPPHKIVNLTGHLYRENPHESSIIEIVFNDPNVQQLARDRYREYRELGYPLKTNKVNV